MTTQSKEKCNKHPGRDAVAYSPEEGKPACLECLSDCCGREAATRANQAPNSIEAQWP